MWHVTSRDAAVTLFLTAMFGGAAVRIAWMAPAGWPLVLAITGAVVLCGLVSFAIARRWAR